MAFAVLLAGILALVFATRTNRSENRHDPLFQDKGSATLSSALREAELVNAYSPALQADLSVHLRPIARISPTKYRDAVSEIPMYFTEGHVVSVDLTGLSDKQAARLVDFCSGYLIGASGWLFRAAEKVIVLTPTERKVNDAP